MIPFQKSKGKIEHAQEKTHRIKADSLELVHEGESLVLRFKSRKASYDIELPVGLDDLSSMIRGLVGKSGK